MGWRPRRREARCTSKHDARTAGCGSGFATPAAASRNRIRREWPREREATSEALLWAGGGSRDYVVGRGDNGRVSDSRAPELRGGGWVKALIADDEPIARQVLREQLEEFPDVRVVGEAANGLEAVERIAQLEPDVVFIDLQMPEMGGFQLARNLRPGRPPVVVYVTAFHQHALQAFETGAVDYLLKPVRKERL